MNQTTVSLPSVAIARLATAISGLQGKTQFAGFTYRSKESNELARHTLILGASYENTVNASLDILRTREHIAVDVAASRILQNDIARAQASVKMFDAMGTDSPNYAANAHDEWIAILSDSKRRLKSFQDMIGPYRSAASELFMSLEDTLSAHAKGEENAAYTKAGMYETICPGLKVSRVDGTFEVSGLAHAKKVIEAGTYKSVNSSAKTIAKNEIRASLPIGKFRTLALDAGALESVRISGNEVDVQDV